MTVRVNVNGRLGSAEEPMISALDAGFLYGASVYESVRTYDGRPFRLAKHLARLRVSAEALSIPVGVSDSELEARVESTLLAASNEDSSVRIIASAGIDATGLTEAKSEPWRQTLVVIVKPLRVPSPDAYENGVRVALVDIIRNHPDSVSPGIKASSLLNNRLAMSQARERGAYEAIMRNHLGEICEAATSNVFIVKNERVITPPLSAGILSGLTREMTLALARDSGYDVREMTITPADLSAADEVFLTASSKEILPVSQVDDRTVGDGRPGPVSLALLQAYRRRVAEWMSELS